MTNHQVVDLHPGTAVAVNGHQPMIVHNVTTSDMSMTCETCGWLGPSRRGRSHHRVEDDWRTHAGDIAMGVQIKHGTVGAGCRCAACAQATRAAAR